MGINLNELPRGGTVCLSKAGLAIGSTPAELSVAAPNGAGVDYAINGVAYHLADDATVVVTAQTVQAVLTKCIYMVLLDSSGTLSTVKGTEQLVADLAAGAVVLQFPTPTADTCPIGYYTVSLASTATYTAATTDLDAANLTVVYVDLFCVPVAPLTS